MRRLLPLLLLAACARPQVPTPNAGAGAANVHEVAVEVANESQRPLLAPRPGLIGQIARLTGGGAASPLSAADAFRVAAMSELQEKGIHARADDRSGHAVFRVALRDLDIRDAAAAGAVAFVSARYLLVDANGETLWETEQKRLPIQLGGPDLTRAQLERIATEAVRHALSSFPAPAPS